MKKALIIGLLAATAITAAVGFGSARAATFKVERVYVCQSIEAVTVEAKSAEAARAAEENGDYDEKTWTTQPPLDCDLEDVTITEEPQS